MPNPRLLSEDLEYKDMVGQLKPTLHIDEFASKMGDDDDIIVASFFVRSKQAAKDLVNWFESGYDWVLDSDVSPGEVRPGRYLVYVELRRRNKAADWLDTALEDLETLTEFRSDEWVMTHDGQEYPWNKDTFRRVVALSPKEYRAQHEQDLNEWRVAAGLDTRQIYEREPDIRKLQSAAGI